MDQQRKHHNFFVDEQFENQSENRHFKCPICLKEMRKLFCPNCIRNGDFTHSTQNFLERFADKKLKFIKLKEQQLRDCNDVQKFFENNVTKSSMTIKINEIERNIRTIREIMNEKRSIISDMKKLLNKHERERLLYHKKQIDVKNKMNRCKNNHATLSYNLNNFYRKKYSIQDELNTLIRKRLNQLTMYKCESNQTRKQQIIRYKIVDSWINLDENFEAATHNNAIECLDVGDNSFRVDHRRIMSALSYLCYLTNLFALISRIHLPRKILFSELTCKRMKRDQFHRRIAQLNANIVFLCCWYRVDIRNELQPKHSIRNIKLALDVAIDAQTNSDYNHLEIRHNLFRMIHNELFMYDMVKITKKSKTFDTFPTTIDTNDNDDDSNKTTTAVADEQDFDFVENNIPDLKLDDPANNEKQPATGILAALVSSIYKRTTTI
ncbi:beclin 1-associated autophagy-related key regulator-like protein [Dermatophagoides farinae]|uniref:Beclin 1-associated autophagy-related key regulator-like protein n=1 Tax=Dermatophagoides farinae TaxID=6954 RepID=A0A9D4P7I1_DERFA|nr:beclin 1-associated autophagy-related key regulator-like protein [Dermatophagoides farinae]